MKRCQLCGCEIPDGVKAFGYEHEAGTHRLDKAIHTASGRSFELHFSISTVEMDDYVPRPAELCEACLEILFSKFAKEYFKTDIIEMKNLMFELNLRSGRLEKLLEKYKD